MVASITAVIELKPYFTNRLQLYIIQAVDSRAPFIKEAKLIECLNKNILLKSNTFKTRSLFPLSNYY